MLAEIPTTNMRLYIGLRAPEGIVRLDTCPSRDAHQAFATGSFPALRQRRGPSRPGLARRPSGAARIRRRTCGQL